MEDEMDILNKLYERHVNEAKEEVCFSTRYQAKIKAWAICEAITHIKLKRSEIGKAESRDSDL